MDVTPTESPPVLIDGGSCPTEPPPPYRGIHDIYGFYTPQLLVSDPRIPPPNQLPENFQFPTALGKRGADDECIEQDKRLGPPDMQDLDACAQQLVAGGTAGNFVADIARCFANREAVRIEHERLLLANLNRRKMAQCATPDTVVSNALVPMPKPDTPRDPVLDQILRRQLGRQIERTCINRGIRVPPCPTSAPQLTSLHCGLPVDGYKSGLPCIRGYPTAFPAFSMPVPDTVVSNPDVNTGVPNEEIDLPPMDDF